MLETGRLEIATNIAAVVALSTIIVGMLFSRRLAGSPITFFSLMWLAFGVLYLFGVSATNVFVAYVLFLVIVFDVSFLIVDPAKAARRPHRSVRDQLIAPHFIVLLTVAAGLLNNAVLIGASGVTLSNPLSIAEYMSFADHYSDQRYLEGISVPVEVRVLNTITHFGSMVAAVLWWERRLVRQRTSIALLLPFASAVLQSLITGNKSIIVVNLIYFVTSYFLVSTYYDRPASRIGAFRIVAIAASLSVGFGVLVHFARSGGARRPLELLERIFTSYFAVPPALLFDWLDSSWTNFIFHFRGGVHTFAGVSVYLIDEVVKRGDREEIEIFGELYYSNVYTAGKELINDFGLLLIFPILVATGLFTGICVRHLRAGKFSAMPALFFIFNMLLFSFAASMYRYLTNVLAILLVGAYFHLSALNSRRLRGRT